MSQKCNEQGVKLAGEYAAGVGTSMCGCFGSQRTYY